MKIDYDDPYNCLAPMGGIMPKCGTWIIIKKPNYWVWKARIEIPETPESDRPSSIEKEFCVFNHAVEFVRDGIARQAEQVDDERIRHAVLKILTEQSMHASRSDNP